MFHIESLGLIFASIWLWWKLIYHHDLLWIKDKTDIWTFASIGNRIVTNYQSLNLWSHSYRNLFFLPKHLKISLIEMSVIWEKISLMIISYFPTWMMILLCHHRKSSCRLISLSLSKLVAFHSHIGVVEIAFRFWIICII